MKLSPTSQNDRLPRIHHRKDRIPLQSDTKAITHQVLPFIPLLPPLTCGDTHTLLAERGGGRGGRGGRGRGRGGGRGGAQLHQPSM